MNLEMFKNLMEAIIILVGGYLLVSTVIYLLKERELTCNPAEAEVDCDCRVYFSKKKNYYYAKARDAAGDLKYVKGSYAKSKEECLSLCRENCGCSA